MSKQAGIFDTFLARVVENCIGAGQPPRVVCAWCEKAGRPSLMREGSLPASHGICEPCAVRVKGEKP